MAMDNQWDTKREILYDDNWISGSDKDGIRWQRRARTVVLNK